MDTPAVDLASKFEMMDQGQAERRRLLRWLLVGTATLPLISCGGASDATAPATELEAMGASEPVAGACAVIPEEMAGPYPADGTNTYGSSIINVLNQPGIVRSDIRSSFNGGTAVAAGVPLSIRLQLLNAGAGCASLAGYAIYLWHCDRYGRYSLYSSGLAGQNYLRGLQETDGNGMLAFTTIFPGCQPGTLPHVHLEIYPSLVQAASSSNRIKTSLLTFPMAAARKAYSASGYETSLANLAQTGASAGTGQGSSLQMASLTGNAIDGYVARLAVAVNG
ncbi:MULTISPECIES: intradiol ring-cleavage dioxygenase [unclassified Janthinobacterium]|uniref:intradiol ring-cleavage dioxygenase n=1 Tax=unclassified Janthinobacterium TaxID=2610881 RepID=UPI00161B89C3|nr:MULTISPECIES: intradiol ring-cleavage dioxygenase [unclassified Janthinobacterium]MBB5368528.1 protocatechuate 3,4-dioxygenase beta subunit [Janthinobacterium sp. K2C7]MBB5381936.1 protocatechuate 3,4-dioxygenase beta subunit [Janthinobacterium sp. K2Li3]MBB5386910.1 protocatechuate 3,4-dioxygenase beta subunit [Janthinobacterium sp. K2E3]